MNNFKVGDMVTFNHEKWHGRCGAMNPGWSKDVYKVTRLSGDVCILSNGQMCNQDWLICGSSINKFLEQFYEI